MLNNPLNDNIGQWKAEEFLKNRKDSFGKNDLILSNE
jgi:hypothetical protein